MDGWMMEGKGREGYVWDGVLSKYNTRVLVYIHTNNYGGALPHFTTPVWRKRKGFVWHGT